MKINMENHPLNEQYRLFATMDHKCPKTKISVHWKTKNVYLGLAYIGEIMVKGSAAENKKLKYIMKTSTDEVIDGANCSLTHNDKYP